MIEGKSFRITKNEVLMTYEHVKANKGLGSVDEVIFQDFKKDFKIEWPQVVISQRQLEELKYLKEMKKVRLLGILTIENKIIAQMVVRDRSEVKIQGIFLVDSYEYIHGR